MLPASATLLRAALGRPIQRGPTSSTFDAWFELARSNRVLPLLHAVVLGAGRELSEDQRGTVRAAQLDAMAWAVRLEHELLEVADALDDEGIAFAVLKGAATAHLDYVDPSLRQLGDVDVLVRPDDLARSRRRLADAGWTEPYALPRGHDRFTHAITFRRDGRGEVDLHQRIAHRALGLLIPTDELLDRPTELVIAGRALRALGPIDRLIHAAVHAVASRGTYRRLSGVADVLVLADRSAGRADDVIERAARWRIAALVMRGIRDAYRDAMLELPAEWDALCDLHIHGDRLVDRAYLSGSRRPLLEELAHLRLMRSSADRVDYLRGFLVTGSEYASERRRKGVVAQLRYLWTRTRSDDR